VHLLCTGAPGGLVPWWALRRAAARGDASGLFLVGESQLTAEQEELPVPATADEPPGAVGSRAAPAAGGAATAQPEAEVTDPVEA